MALSLTRKNNESIALFDADGRRVIITVDDTQSNQVRLNIDAPKDIMIMRAELGDRLDAYYSMRVFIEHPQYYQGCSSDVHVGVGSTSEDAVRDALEMAYQAGDGPHGVIANHLDRVADQMGRDLWVMRHIAEFDTGRELTDDEVHEVWDNMSDWEKDGIEHQVYCELEIHS